MASQNSMETRTDAGRLGVACLQLAVGAEDNIGRIAHEVGLVAKRFPWVSMVLTSELCGHGPSPDAAEAMPGDSERHTRRPVSFAPAPSTPYQTSRRLSHP